MEGEGEGGQLEDMTWNCKFLCSSLFTILINVILSLGYNLNWREPGDF